MNKISNKIHTKEAIKIAVIYGIIGTLWILGSDYVFSSIETYTSFIGIQIVKGTLFVILTSLLIYSLVNNLLKRIFKAEEEFYIQKEKGQQKIISNEKRLNTAFEVSNDGIWELFIESGKLNTSERFNEILGFELNNAINTYPRFKEVIHPDFKDDFESHILYLLTNSSNTLNKNYKAFNSQKEEIWINIKCRPTKIENQKVSEVLGIISDITPVVHKELELKNRYEEQLTYTNLIRENEEKFKAIFINNIIPMILIDRTGKIIETNIAIQKLFGYSEQEFKNKRSFSELIHPDDLEVSIKWFAKLLENEVQITPHIEKRYLKKDGTLFWGRHSATAMRDGNGNFLYSCGMVEDLTEIIFNKEEITRLLSAVEQSNQMIAITDLDCGIIYVNPKYSIITKYPKEELIGKHLVEFLPLQESITIKQEILKNLSSGLSWRGEFQAVKKDGSLYWEEFSISPIRNSRNEISNYLVIKEDITSRKLEVNRLIVAKEKAEKADKLKIEFLAQMSHEIRTPLNSILAYTSLIKQEVTNKKIDSLLYFDVIENSSNRLIRTIELILNMAEIQTGNFDANFESFNIIDASFNKIIKKYKEKALSKNLDFVFLNSAKKTIINADRFSFEQILINLIENAVNFTNKGMVKVLVYNDYNLNVAVDVIDTGIGISDSFKENIFQPFCQEEMGFARSYDGNGLGLALTKKYVEVNKGTIKFESEKGIGSTFTVSFPGLQN